MRSAESAVLAKKAAAVGEVIGPTVTSPVERPRNAASSRRLDSLDPSGAVPRDLRLVLTPLAMAVEEAAPSGTAKSFAAFRHRARFGKSSIWRRESPPPEKILTAVRTDGSRLSVTNRMTAKGLFLPVPKNRPAPSVRKISRQTSAINLFRSFIVMAVQHSTGEGGF